MHLNCTSELKVTTIWISQELPCSISSVSIYYAPKSDIRVKIYVHLNFSRASVVQFRASLYIMHLNLTSELKDITIWISRELPCSTSSVSIYYAPESDLRVKSYDHLNFSRASVVQFRASRYIFGQNQTSEWKLMIIWISRELSLFNFECLNILCVWIWHSSKKLWPFEFQESFLVQLQASRYIMRLNLIFVWKLMKIWISRELPLFNFERLNILCAWIRPPS